jgi:choline dehydrogenase-like flavoprotein
MIFVHYPVTEAGEASHMILDIHECQPDSPLVGDVCIIGSGAAGITLAREFIGTQHSVLMLEGGGNSFEKFSQDPYRSLVTGLPHGGIHEGRVRILGGSTTLWAGQALRLFDIDFAKRDWVPYSGWPIDRTTLDPYYLRAEDVMKIPRSTNDQRSWPSPNYPPPDYDAQKLTTSYSQFAAVPNFSDKYREVLMDAPNIRLLLHANVTQLIPNESASALREVHVQSLDGHALLVHARYFIICCGGIENARLLLLSNSVERNGIGNRYDVVGRFFQDHPGIALPIKALQSKRFQALYNSTRHNGVRCSVKIMASPEFQRSHKVLHVGSEVYYPIAEDDPIRAAKDLLKGVKRRQFAGLPTRLARIALRPQKVIGAALRHYIRGMPASVGSGDPYLGVGGEQQPNPSSRVSLYNERDALGLRRTKLNWCLTSDDSRSILTFATVLASEWKRLGIAELNTDSIEILGREKGKHGGYVDANHHMGTTRMGTDPTTSVVDARCRVHGYDNLYIGGSSVFPTGGFSNPTLTVLALCLRIADELKERLTTCR